MKTIYTSIRPDSLFAIVEVDGIVYAVDEDSSVGGWGKYEIVEPSIFLAGHNERIRVTPEGDVTRIGNDEIDTDHYDVFFGDFDFGSGSETLESLFE
jgi:hypothetical protein